MPDGEEAQLIEDPVFETGGKTGKMIALDSTYRLVHKEKYCGIEIGNKCLRRTLGARPPDALISPAVAKPHACIVGADFN